jgi:hypothetical protein
MGSASRTVHENTDPSDWVDRIKRIKDHDVKESGIRSKNQLL